MPKVIFIGYNLTHNDLRRESLVSGEIKNANYLLRELRKRDARTTSISVNLWDKGCTADHCIKKSSGKGVLRWILEARRLNKIIQQIAEPSDTIYLTVPSYLPFLNIPKDVSTVITAHGTYWPELKADLAYESNWIKKALHLVNGYTQLLIDQASFRKADRIHSVSEFQVREMLQTYKVPQRKLFALRNGTDFERVQAGHQRYDIFWVGRLAKKKNLSLLRQFMLANPGLRVGVCVGNDYFAIDQASRDVLDQIDATIYRDISDADLNELLNGSKCLLVTSTGYESIPTVIYEALASGCAVLAPDSWGIREVQAEASGLYTYNEGSLDSLSAAYRQLLASPRDAGSVSDRVRWVNRAAKFVMEIAA